MAAVVFEFDGGRVGPQAGRDAADPPALQATVQPRSAERRDHRPQSSPAGVERRSAQFAERDDQRLVVGAQHARDRLFRPLRQFRGAVSKPPFGDGLRVDAGFARQNRRRRLAALERPAHAGCRTGVRMAFGGHGIRRRERFWSHHAPEKTRSPSPPSAGASQFARRRACASTPPPSA